MRTILPALLLTALAWPLSAAFRPGGPRVGASGVAAFGECRPSGSEDPDAAAEPPKSNGPIQATALTVPSAGRHTVDVTVARFGRYALRVRSASGTALQLVDRMSGPGTVAGKAGESDGRLDVFLDRGTYRLVTYGPPKGKGTARLLLSPFEEKSGANAPLLVETKAVDATLGDLEQRSFWLKVDERRPVFLEAAGRDLVDLRLWRDGTWLVDAEPARDLVQPVTGRPMTICRLTEELSPGLYLVTAYGGVGPAWAEESPEHPFHLRFGVSALPEASRRRFAVGPYGLDRYLVPGPATYFRLELPQAGDGEKPREARLSVAAYDPRSPLSGSVRTAEVTKKSLRPVAELLVAGAGSGGHLVTVTGVPGQSYVLSHFESRWQYPIPAAGRYWISTLHAGAAADSVDATALLVESSGSRRVEPLRRSVVRVDGKAPYGRRANLMDELEVFLFVGEPGVYLVAGGGTATASFRVEPFLVSQPDGYRPPDWKASGAVWELDAGYHVLRARPERKGILELQVRKLELGEPATPAPPFTESGAVRSGATFPDVTLAENRGYVLYLARQPEVTAGVQLRPLPLDLARPLAVTQRPGEELSFPFRAEGPGRLFAISENEAPIRISLDGAAPVVSPEVEAGSHTATVKLEGDATLVYTLGLTPRALLAETPLPPLPDADLATLPRFEKLEEGAPLHLDLERNETRSFLLSAARPALHRLESTGLLRTRGNLRTRTRTSLLSAEENGVGRNFLVQGFLREGDYQLTVGALGESRGHLGLHLAASPLRDGGSLSTEVPARTTLAPGEAVVYRLHVAKAGTYRLRALGLGRTFLCRLEDGDGWPILAPGLRADLTHRLAPGDYRLVILPQDLPARVVTTLARVERPPRFSGKGPHRLPLGVSVEHLWREGGKSGRRPDVFLVDLPAAARLRVALTEGMLARLVPAAAPGGPPVGEVPAGGAFEGPLAAGRYRLEVLSARPNDRQSYRVEVGSEELLAGASRLLGTLPADVWISVGKAGLVELSSSGEADVKASLLDEAGALLSRSDDREGDWNFEITRTLAAGRYRLRVEAAGGSARRTTVAMNVLGETLRPPLVLGSPIELTPGRAALLVPLPRPLGGELLLATASSGEIVGLALEAEGEAGTWRPLGSVLGRNPLLAVPLRDATGAPALRLRVWSADRRGSPVTLRAVATTPPRLAEPELLAGAGLPGVVGLGRAVSAASLGLSQPGVLRFDAGSGVRATSRVESVCEALPDDLLAAPEGGTWLVREGGGRLRVARVQLGAEGLEVPVPAGGEAHCDVSPGRAGPLVVVARTLSGQPGVVLSEPGSVANDASARMVAGPRSAASVLLSSSRRAVARVLDAGEGGEPLFVSLRSFSFEAPAREPLDSDVDGELGPGKARAFTLPAGAKRVTLSLGEDVVGVLSRGSEVLSVHWGGGEPLQETARGPATDLTLLSLRSVESRFAARVLPGAPESSGAPAEAADAAVAPRSPYERAHPVAGTALVPVADPDLASPGRAVLHVRGATSEPVLVTRDGRVRRGLDIPLTSPGGLLRVPHAPGLVLAWVDRAGTEGQDLWIPGGARAVDVTAPATLALSGGPVVLRLSPKEPVLLSLRAATPSVSFVRREGGSDVEVHTGATRLDAYFPGGPAEVRLRPFAGGALSGTAEITATAVTPVREGLGPPALLGPGASRIYSFRVDRPGKVGIGVRASSDVVGCDLLSSTGKRLGSGVVQMPALSPGTYLLVLRAPADGPPITVRPALAGLETPSSDPPPEVVRGYVDPGLQDRSFSARTVAGTTRVARDAEEDGTEEPDAQEPEETEEEPDTDTEESPR